MLGSGSSGSNAEDISAPLEVSVNPGRHLELTVNTGSDLDLVVWRVRDFDFGFGFGRMINSSSSSFSVVTSLYEGS